MILTEIEVHAVFGSGQGGYGRSVYRIVHEGGGIPAAQFLRIGPLVCKDPGSTMDVHVGYVSVSMVYHLDNRSVTQKEADDMFRAAGWTVRACKESP